MRLADPPRASVLLDAMEAALAPTHAVLPLVFVVTYRGYARAAGKTPLPPVRPFTRQAVGPLLDEPPRLRSEVPLERGAPGEPPYLRVSLAESTRSQRAELMGFR